MTKSILTNSLLLGGVVLAAAACSSEALSDINPDEALGNPKINITVKTPSAEGVVVRGTVEDESDERTINYLNVYLFEEGSSTSENNYTLRSVTKFTTDGNDGVKFTPGTDAQSTTTCSLDIPASLMGKKVRIGILANDTPAVTTGMTLTEFRIVLATATLADEDEGTDGVQVSADALVGGVTAKSFPMSAITASTAKLTPYGLDVTAELVRTVSRIDICNYATDLIITGVKITGANDKSCLNAGSATGVNVPATAVQALTINPLTEYSNRFITNMLGAESVKGIPYDDSWDSEDYTAEDIKKGNTHRAFYLYEQSSSASTPKVTIDYVVWNGSTKKTGTVDVSFYSKSEYVDATRNHLYTIQLGDGSAVSQGEVSVVFKAAEWTEGETIDTDLDLVQE